MVLPAGSRFLPESTIQPHNLDRFRPPKLEKSLFRGAIAMITIAFLQQPQEKLTIDALPYKLAATD